MCLIWTGAKIGIQLENNVGRYKKCASPVNLENAAKRILTWKLGLDMAENEPYNNFQRLPNNCQNAIQNWQCLKKKQQEQNLGAVLGEEVERLRGDGEEVPGAVDDLRGVDAVPDLRSSILKLRLRGERGGSFFWQQINLPFFPSNFRK